MTPCWDWSTPVRASRYRDERGKVPEVVELPIPRLFPRHRTMDTKAGNAVVSPAINKPGAMRGKRSVAAVQFFVLDFDHLAAEDANGVVALVKELGLAGLLSTSFSNGANGDDDCCFRLVLPQTREVSPAEYERLWPIVNGALGGLADANARDVSRIWYEPSCPASRLQGARYTLYDGAPLDVDELLSRAPPPPPRGGRDRGARRGAAPEGPIPDGQRNGALVQMAGAMRRRGMGEAAISAALREVNRARCRPPLTDAEVDAIAASVSRYDPADPLLVHHCTDLGNAERLQHRMGDALLYIHPGKRWIHWDGCRYVQDNSGEALRQAAATIRAMLAAADAVTDTEEHDRLVKHAMESESAARLNGMLTLATSRLPEAVEALDAKPMLFNVLNGTVDLTTGILRPHDRADRLTKVAHVRYDPLATCPRWLGFLRRVAGGSEELVRFLQRAVGYSLSGSVREQVLFLLHGTGANGKSTFLETVRALIGDYFVQADFTSFVARPTSDAPRNDLARLAGARMVAAVEADAGQSLAEATVKQITGGDTITARMLYGEFFDFRPAFKLWLAANHKPNIRGGDLGIWRRIRLVPFIVTIPEHERDPNLPDALRAELPGILNWAIEGCLAWQRDGLGAPAEVRDATASYREEMDILGDFVDARCFLGPEERVTAKELYDAYTAWCGENGDAVLSQKGLGRRLREKGLMTVKAAKGVRCWQGIRIRATTDAEGAGGGWQEGALGPAKFQGSLFAPRSRSDEAASRETFPEEAPPSATRHPTEPPEGDVEEGEL